MIPRLPDVTQIPEASWEGWEHIFTELQVDRSDEQQVKETIERCQTMLGSLLQAALMSGQQQQQGVEVTAVAPLGTQVRHAREFSLRFFSASQLLETLIGLRYSCRLTQAQPYHNNTQSSRHQLLSLQPRALMARSQLLSCS